MKDHITFFDIAGFSLIFSSLLYFSGWIYSYYFFVKFNLGIICLEIPKEYFFMYGFWVIKYNLCFFIIFALLIVGITFIQQFKESLKLLCTIALIIIIFSMSFGLSKETAKRIYDDNMENNFNENPSVEVILKPELTVSTDDKTIHKLSSGVYRLLLNTGNKVFYF